MRFRVVMMHHDDGAFGYTAPPVEEVIGDWLTRAEAKAIYRHYSVRRLWEEDNCTIAVESMTEDGWHNCSDYWAYRELEEQERWFDEKGFDYSWWLMFGEIRRI